jgi:hypothetical protein
MVNVAKNMWVSMGVMGGCGCADPPWGRAARAVSLGPTFVRDANAWKNMI